jgi:hypothetical protein
MKSMKVMCNLKSKMNNEFEHIEGTMMQLRNSKSNLSAVAESCEPESSPVAVADPCETQSLTPAATKEVSNILINCLNLF